MTVQAPAARGSIELWGGVESTINRVGDSYFNQLERSGHAHRPDDLERCAALGIRALRYPVLWEQVAPHGPQQADWRWPEQRLTRLRELGVNPIAGLVHHGSGPPHTSLLDPDFAPQLAAYAGALAQRFPWLRDYTPVNEPLTTARFCGLYGVWYPHRRDDASFVRALLNQCRAVVLSMEAVREANPAARLVQTDDLGKTYGTDQMHAYAGFYNERRWLAWDLLCGMVDRAHPLWGYLVRHGAGAAELDWLRRHACKPDIIGVNYYVTSERWLDHRAGLYPPHVVGAEGFADIEAARVLATPTPGVAPLLEEAWERYGLPLAITEAHLAAPREDQLRWMAELWRGAHDAAARGAEVRAVTAWSLLGAYDWNSLVTRAEGYYESGAYDLRGPAPRPTAVAGLLRELGSGRTPSHPVLRGAGWWRRPGRFLCPPVASSAASAVLPPPRSEPPPPILIVGAGALGRACARLCAERNLAYLLLDRGQLDIADHLSVELAIATHRPWAVINAAGYGQVRSAQRDPARCRRDNAIGPAVLAAACARHGAALLTFSSDLVFDGAHPGPYLESDAPSPRHDCGRHKAEAERSVLLIHPDALVVRTSALFGPWDGGHFLARLDQALAQGTPLAAAHELVTPTYLPDLLHTCLDLLIDRERGLWHLSHGDAVSWLELGLRYCALAGHDHGVLQAAPSGATMVRRALASERGQLLPPLEQALARYRDGAGCAQESPEFVHSLFH